MLYELVHFGHIHICVQESRQIYQQNQAYIFPFPELSHNFSINNHVVEVLGEDEGLLRVQDKRKSLLEFKLAGNSTAKVGLFYYLLKEDWNQNQKWRGGEAMCTK